MRRLIEPSHLDLCCLQKPIIITVAVKELTDPSVFGLLLLNMIFVSINACFVQGVYLKGVIQRFDS